MKNSGVKKLLSAFGTIVMVAVALIAGGVGNSVGKLVGNGVGEIAAPVLR